jgi:hypothetical protein
MADARLRGIVLFCAALGLLMVMSVLVKHLAREYPVPQIIWARYFFAFILMLALSIYDLLVPDDLTRGKKVAGTGTIENRKGHSGVVGEVGAIKQKVESARRIGAQVFLVPRAELEAAQKAAEPSMLVVGVSTLREAISALSKISPD